MHILRKAVFLASGALALAATSARGELNFGSDVVSRYIWRGSDFGDHLSVQPSISWSVGDAAGKGSFEVGTWASYPLTTDPGVDNVNENDIWLSYYHKDLILTLTDYYFPGAGVDFFDFEDEDGAHSIEIAATYSLAPLSLFAGWFFLNDTEENDSVYIQVDLALPKSSRGIETTLFAAVGNGQYTEDFAADPTGAEDFELVNLGISLSREGYSATYILNPDRELSFLVFGKNF